MTEFSNFFATRPERAEAPRTLVLYLSYSFMFESTKQKGRRSLMLSKQ